MSILFSLFRLIKAMLRTTAFNLSIQIISELSKSMEARLQRKRPRKIRANHRGRTNLQNPTLIATLFWSLLRQKNQSNLRKLPRV